MLFAAVCCIHTAQADINHLLPKPQQATVQTGQFSLAQPIRLVLPTFQADAPRVEAELRELVGDAGGHFSESATATISVALVDEVAGAEFQDEAYNLLISGEAVNIQAKTPIGALRAAQTLRQLAQGRQNTVPACHILDWAAWRVRGYMHDIGRSYLPFERLKEEVVRLARYKVNVFHWHLTDNQGWRLESAVYPQLNQASSYSRHAGQFYTKAQAKELVALAKSHGMTVIPEIDFPGHSEAFRRAMGHSMMTPQGLEEMKKILTEACEVFDGTEWMHIGTDEVRQQDLGTIPENQFVPVLTAHLKQLGRKIMSWNPGYHHATGQVDMTQMWSSAGRPTAGVPAVDSRYHYINHFDQYADVVGLYNSNIAGQQKGSQQYAGTIIGMWNDRLMSSYEAVINENAFYASLLAMAERAWRGGGERYIEKGGVTLDAMNVDFFDWERRFLFHKSTHLSDAPISYVKQTNIHWRITDPFPNGGNTAAIFPPETERELGTSFTHNGNTYGTGTALGGGIYLRHVWGTIVPAYYASPQPNSTAYAYTYVYSPTSQTVGAQVEFHNYGRSEADLAPPQGKWDYKGSRIWVNDSELLPPTWSNTHTTKSNETALGNENFPARPLLQVQLNEGWNKVLIKLPITSFTSQQVRLVKWMFTCVFTTLDGKRAADGLIYSPRKNMNAALEVLLSEIENAQNALRNSTQGEEPGEYGATQVATLQAAIAQAQSIAGQTSIDEATAQQAATTLRSATSVFVSGVNMPKVSSENETFWYRITAPLRFSDRAIAYQGDGNAVKADVYAENQDKFLWKVVAATDGTFRLINKASNVALDIATAQNSGVKATTAATSASSAWTFQPVENGYFAITAGNVQLNQTNAGHQYQIFNWGGGNNFTDQGCLWKLSIAKVESENPLTLLQELLRQYQVLRRTASVGIHPGMYPTDAVALFDSRVNDIRTFAQQAEANVEDINRKRTELQSIIAQFKISLQMPQPSTEQKSYWYHLISARENRAVTAPATTGNLQGEPVTDGNDRQLWKLTTLDNKFALVNKSSGCYIATSSSTLTVANGTPTAGWVFTPIAGGQYFTITSGTHQFNQGNVGTAFRINNWGSGTNTSDEGCRYIIRLASAEDTSSIRTATADKDSTTLYHLSGHSAKKVRNKGIYLNNKGKKILVK